MSKCYDDPRPTIQDRLRHPDLFKELTDGEYQHEVAGRAADEIDRLRAELADLREAAFEVERFALPYWVDGGDGDPQSIPVGNKALRDLQIALYPEELER